MKHELNAHGLGCLTIIIMTGLAFYAVLHIIGVAK